MKIEYEVKMASRHEWTDEKLFLRLLNNKSDRTYWDNIRALRKRPTKEVFNKCVELISSKDAKTRRIGINVLAQLGTTPRPFYKESNRLFFELLRTEKDTEALIGLLYAIGHNNDALSKVQVDALCELGSSDGNVIKRALIHSLLGVDRTSAIDTLIKFSADKTGYIRDWATFGLGTINSRDNKKIREALWARVDDKNVDAKYEAIVGLAKRKDARVKEIIMQELLSKEYGSALFDAIIEYDDKWFLPLLRRHYKEERNNNDIDPGWIECLKYCIAELSRKK